MSCPCGSKIEIDKCCGPFLSGKAFPDTAEKLMRSRYSAFTQVNIDYIRGTHDPNTVGEVDFLSTKTWAETAKWLGLEIIKKQDGLDKDMTGTVEFVARYISAGVIHLHHEESHFVRLKRVWYFSFGRDPNKKPI